MGFLPFSITAQMHTAIYVRIENFAWIGAKKTLPS